MLRKYRISKINFRLMMVFELEGMGSCAVLTFFHNLLSEVQDQKRDHPGGRATGKAVQAVHADENGYEAFQPQDVGKPNDGNLV